MSRVAIQSESPYVAASAALRLEFERLADSNRMLRHSLAAMATALVLSSLLSMYLLRKPHIIPYVIQLDRSGEILGVAEPIAANAQISESVVRYVLARFISDARSVLADGSNEKAALHRVYDMAQGSAAATLPVWYRTHPPFEIATRETVQTDIDSVLREPSGTYEVRWTETTRNLNGDVLSTARWRALLAIELLPPDPDHMLSNPIGLYVTEIDWSKEQG
jgi:type IV secretion system protein TrbF